MPAYAKALNVEGPTVAVQEQVKRALTVAEAAAGQQSEIYLNALLNQANLLIMLDRPAEARPLAERAFTLAQQKFSDAPEFNRTAFVLFYACNALGDMDCARRTNDAAIAVERKGNRDGQRRHPHLHLESGLRLHASQRLEPIFQRLADGPINLVWSFRFYCRCGRLRNSNCSDRQRAIGRDCRARREHGA